MTSPNQPKPDHTSSVYDDVYAVGSNFGQDLRRENDEATEVAVRNLLMSQGKSPFETALGQVIEFFDNLLSGIVEGIKGLLGGAVELGTDLWNSAVSTVGGFIRGIFDAIGNLFGIRRGEPAKPLPPVYSEIKTDIEAATQPMFDAIDEAHDTAAEAIENVSTLQGEVSGQLERVDTALEESETLIRAVEAHGQDTARRVEEVSQEASAALDKAEQGIADAKAVNDKLPSISNEIATLGTDLGKVSGDLDASVQALSTLDTRLTKAASDAQSTANQAKTAADAAVTNTVVEYAVGTSETTAPTTGWSTSTPTRTPGSFVWMRSRITYGSGNTTVTSPALLTGNTGAKGAKGADGLPGKDGVGVKTTTVTYATSTSGTTAPTSGWTAAVPTLTKGRYLWTKTLWTYTDNSTETGYSVTYVAKDGSSGTDGLPGKDGVGITGTAITYAKSSSGTSAPTTGWAAQPPATSPGDFMWTKTVWTYSDNTTETGYTVGKIGNTGAKGATGDQGVSVTSVTPYYRLVTKGAAAPATPTTATPSGWTTTEPGYVADRELFRADKVTYSNSTFTWTDVSRVSAYTAASQANDGLVAVNRDLSQLSDSMNKRVGESGTLTQQLKAAEEAAAQANTAIRNSVNTGLSLVPLFPGTQEPVWASGADKVAITGVPNVTHAYSVTGRKVLAPPEHFVKANPSQKYRVSFWARADQAGTRLFMELRDQDGVHAVQSGGIRYDGQGLTSTYIINNLDVPVSWTKYETVIALREGVELVRPASVYWNHSNGVEGKQWIADLRIDPEIPLQTDVEKALADSAQAQSDYNALNTRLWGAQGELNKVNSAMWDTQTGWNATQEKLNKAVSDSLTAMNNYTKINNDLWGAQGEFNRISAEFQAHSTEIDKAQNEAIKANTDLARLAFPHLNILPNQPNGDPWWAEGMGVNSTLTPPDFPAGRSYWTSSNLYNYGQDALFSVPDSVDLRLEFWTARVSGDNGTAGAFVNLVSESGFSNVIESWADITEGIPENGEIPWSTRTYAGNFLGSGSEWEKRVYLLRPKPGYTRLALSLRPGATAEKEGTRVRFWGAKLTAFFPLQSEVDSAQNEAIRGLLSAQDAQSKINEEQKRSQDALMEAQEEISEALATMRSYIPRLMIVPDASYGAPSSKPYLRDDYVQVRYDSTTSLLVDARGSTWAGKIVVTANYVADSLNPHRTQTRYFTFDIKDTGRTNGIPRRPENGINLDNVRIDYYVEPGSLQVNKVTKDWSSSPYVAPQDPSWYEQTSDNFVFTANTKEEVLHNAMYKVGWHSAARVNAVYKIRVRKVSAEGNVTVWPQERVQLGPMFPWEDGYREMTITTAVPMKEGDKLYFGFSVGTTGGTVTSDQRRVRNQERKVSWVAQSN